MVFCRGVFLSARGVSNALMTWLYMRCTHDGLLQTAPTFRLDCYVLIDVIMSEWLAGAYKATPTFSLIFKKQKGDLSRLFSFINTKF